MKKQLTMVLLLSIVTTFSFAQMAGGLIQRKGAVGGSILGSTLQANADISSENIKVWGNCDMSKSKIEKAAKKAGAISADWDLERRNLSVTFLSTKTSSIKIQQNIANAGFDTEGVEASINAYRKLKDCCKYERKSVQVY
jgi:hypothetical protein